MLMAAKTLSNVDKGSILGIRICLYIIDLLSPLCYLVFLISTAPNIALFVKINAI